MRCLICEQWSFSSICSSCQVTFLRPTIHSQKLVNGIEVVSFYPYDEIESLLHTKHTFIGSSVFTILARYSFLQFAQNYISSPSVVIPIDDHVRNGWSHTAILAKACKSTILHPCYNLLRAQNHVNYSGQTLSFRQANPRNFYYSGKNISEAILIDDIITTGITLIEASELLLSKGVNIPFCLTLSYVKRN